jgi:hypothetical protein
MTKKNNTFKVETRLDAQRTIAELLRRFSGGAAKNRMRETGQYAHQSDEEVAWRVAGNLLTSFERFRPFQ